MLSPLEPRPISSSDITLINQQYLSHGARSDPTMVWGTDVDAESLTEWIAERNRYSDTLISIAHVLTCAVAHSLTSFPKLNCRILRGRIYRFRSVNVRMISYNARKADVDILTVHQADRMSLEDVSRFVWRSQLELAEDGHSDNQDKALLNWGPAITRRWGSRLFWWLERNFRLPRLGRIDRHFDSSVVVNYLGFPGAPPMRMYKPSKFPDESSLLSVTLGRVEHRPVVDRGAIVSRRVAPLYVRADHRVTDAYGLGRFVATLREVLIKPQLMETRTDDDSVGRDAA